jgi:hypothetical protein
MRRHVGWIATAIAIVLDLQGCAVVLSHGYSDVVPNNRPTISESDWTWGALHLTEPMVEDLVIDLTRGMEAHCRRSSKPENVQTKLMLREFVLFQIYSVRLTAQCSAPAPDQGKDGPEPTRERAVSRAGIERGGFALLRRLARATDLDGPPSSRRVAAGLIVD